MSEVLRRLRLSRLASVYVSLWMMLSMRERCASVASYLAGPQPGCMWESSWSVLFQLKYFSSSVLKEKHFSFVFDFAVEQDTPFGNWDGYYKEEKLCHIPSPLYGQLLPLTKVSPGTAAAS